MGFAYSENTARVRSSININEVLRNVYLWMALGLLMTAVVAFLTSRSPSLLSAVYSGAGLILVCAVEIGLVIFLAGRITTMRASTAVGCFIAYSIVNGFTLSSVLLVYAGALVSKAFFTACAMFAAMSLYGLSGKRDMTGFGNFALMALFGLIIAGVINMIFRSSVLDTAISVLGVVLFSAITAYDTQKISNIGYTVPADDEEVYIKVSILGALTLYLDFVNLFLYLIRIFGNSRNNR